MKLSLILFCWTIAQGKFKLRRLIKLSIILFYSFLATSPPQFKSSITEKSSDFVILETEESVTVESSSDFVALETEENFTEKSSEFVNIKIPIMTPRDMKYFLQGAGKCGSFVNVCRPDQVAVPLSPRGVGHVGDHCLQSLPPFSVAVVERHRIHHKAEVPRMGEQANRPLHFP